MTTFANARHLLTGAVGLLDPDTGTMLRVLSLQYNSNRLFRGSQLHLPEEQLL